MTKEEAAEEDFWGPDGVNQEMDKQVSEYIEKHRTVTAVNFRPDESQDEWDEQEWKASNNSNVYRNSVNFSAYSEDYTNNLSEIAVEGRIKIKVEKEDFFGMMEPELRKDYESEIMTNPTWIDLCLCANDMINCTGDNHHIFLEGIHKTGSFTLDDKSFVLLYEFSMGS